ncbi:hypothetical protein EVAR_44596_1 [Eumeta japonica]|uniref:Uncharacterized protein n=1 Tax=Eumeta variegata TaxID=151549 RepID=A0A4C1X8T9_EUMVA|nr:hypothetical protein EVAR_44596_1 [Eumeta japonica]
MTGVHDLSAAAPAPARAGPVRYSQRINHDTSRTERVPFPLTPVQAESGHLRHRLGDDVETGALVSLLKKKKNLKNKPKFSFFAIAAKKENLGLVGVKVYFNRPSYLTTSKPRKERHSNYIDNDEIEAKGSSDANTNGDKTLLVTSRRETHRIQGLVYLFTLQGSGQAPLWYTPEKITVPKAWFTGRLQGALCYTSEKITVPKARLVITLSGASAGSLEHILEVFFFFF